AFDRRPRRCDSSGNLGRSPAQRAQFEQCGVDCECCARRPRAIRRVTRPRRAFLSIAWASRHPPWPRLVGPHFTPRRTVAPRAPASSLDVAAWVGSGGARAALHESGGDSFDAYQDTLDRLRLARPEDTSPWSAARHRTPYLSMIDAIETWLLPSEGDAVQPAA